MPKREPTLDDLQATLDQLVEQGLVFCVFADGEARYYPTAAGTGSAEAEPPGG